MSNFEIIDNLFQVGILFICLIVSIFEQVKTKKQIFIALSGMYGSFMIGTLFYLLHLIIIGETPHISYCAEISWLASFIFMMQITIVRAKGKEKSFSPASALLAILFMAFALYNKMLGPLFIFVITSTIVIGVSVYLSARKIEEKRKSGTAISCLEVFIPLIILFDIMVYFVSIFVSDYSVFSIYYVFDALVTLSFAVMLIMYIREERKG